MSLSPNLERQPQGISYQKRERERERERQRERERETKRKKERELTIQILRKKETKRKKEKEFDTCKTDRDSVQRCHIKQDIRVAKKDKTPNLFNL